MCAVDVRGGWAQWMRVEVVCGGCVWRSCKEVVRGGWVQRLGEKAHHQRLWADLFVVPNGREQHEQVFETLHEEVARGRENVGTFLKKRRPHLFSQSLVLLLETSLSCPVSRAAQGHTGLRALEGGGGSQAEEQRGNRPATGAWSRVGRMQGYPSGKQHIKRIRQSSHGEVWKDQLQENIDYGILCHHTYSLIVLGQLRFSATAVRQFSVGKILKSACSGRSKGPTGIGSAHHIRFRKVVAFSFDHEDDAFLGRPGPDS
ncbi:hypothetical protein B0H14DRAFT_3163814 [Mycena olivaceomarginata]|nr:hypothetical protein B0H14DRAFT_3163814 [Mycena olivaceomarginata]